MTTTSIPPASPEDGDHTDSTNQREQGGVFSREVMNRVIMTHEIPSDLPEGTIAFVVGMEYGQRRIVGQVGRLNLLDDDGDIMSEDAWERMKDALKPNAPVVPSPHAASADCPCTTCRIHRASQPPRLSDDLSESSPFYPRWAAGMHRASNGTFQFFPPFPPPPLPALTTDEQWWLDAQREFTDSLCTMLAIPADYLTEIHRSDLNALLDDLRERIQRHIRGL